MNKKDNIQKSEIERDSKRMVFKSARAGSRTWQYYIPSELFRYEKNIRTFLMCAWQIL